MSLLGRGVSYPLNKSASGGLDYTEDIQRINQSLFLIFETPKGSRLMMPEFGSDIHLYKFDPLDRALMERLRYTITKDIAKNPMQTKLILLFFFLCNALTLFPPLYIFIITANFTSLQNIYKKYNSLFIFTCFYQLDISS